MSHAIFRSSYGKRKVIEVNPNLDQQRIILANRPRLLREIIKRAFQRYPDMRIVGELSESINLLQCIEQLRAHWIVISLSPNGKFPEFVDLLMHDYPNIGVLAFATDGSKAKARCGDNSEEDLSNMTLNELMEVIRLH